MEPVDTIADNKLPLNDPLCLPRKSFTFWALLVFAFFVLVGEVRHFRTWSGFCISASLTILSMFVYFRAHTMIAELALQFAGQDKVLNRLKTIGGFIVTLVVYVLTACTFQRF